MTMKQSCNLIIKNEAYTRRRNVEEKKSLFKKNLHFIYEIHAAALHTIKEYLIVKNMCKNKYNDTYAFPFINHNNIETDKLNLLTCTYLCKCWLYAIKRISLLHISIENTSQKTQGSVKYHMNQKRYQLLIMILIVLLFHKMRFFFQ